MSLSAALTLFLEEYRDAMGEEFAGHPVADFVRNEVPRAVEAILGEKPRYVVRGSAGQGNWARSPWVAIFDRLITETAQKGFYLVYLVKEDFSGVYLSLNQGVTNLKEIYGVGAKEALRVRAADFLARLDLSETSYIVGSLDLATHAASDLAAYYEEGNICAKYYPRGALPGDDALGNDLTGMMELYAQLADKELHTAGGTTTLEDDEVGLEQEDLTKLREHKRIERNQRLARKAKQIHGFVCQACGFDFEKRYGEIGKEFIEAHHLVPLASQEGQTLTLDPETDFAVLCSNCHRMIHRSNFTSSPEEFARAHLFRNA